VGAASRTDLRRRRSHIAVMLGFPSLVAVHYATRAGCLQSCAHILWNIEGLFKAEEA
jgi:hypothetical protein